MTNQTKAVRIVTVNVGQSFATAAIIQDARTGRKLGETRDFPYGFAGSAVAAAEALAEKNGWRVVDSK